MSGILVSAPWGGEVAGVTTTGLRFAIDFILNFQLFGAFHHKHGKKGDKTEKLFYSRKHNCSVVKMSVSEKVKSVTFFSTPCKHIQIL